MMEQNSPTRLAKSRICCWLMAGASVLATAGAAQGGTGSAYWILPGVLSDKAEPFPREGAHARQAAQPVVGPIHKQIDALAPFLAYQPLLPVPASQTAALLPRLASGSAVFEPLLSQRISWLASGRGGPGLALPVGGTSEVDALGGRLRMSTFFMDDDAGVTPRDFNDPEVRDRPRDRAARQTTRRHRIAAQLVDSGNLKLLVDGEMGQLSEGAAAVMLPLVDGRFVFPGSWSTISSRLEYGATNVTVGYQDYESRDEARSREQITVGFKASELQVYRRQGAEFSLINGGQWLRRTTFSGISADLLVADVLPSAIADTLDPVRHLLPTSLSGGFERGDVTRAEITVGPRDRVSTAHLAMSWQGRFGETTASLRERRITTDMMTPGAEDGVRLSRSSDRYADLSHSMRRGNWKLGAGLSLIQTDDDVLGRRTAESQMAPHVSIGYAPDRGPRVELRYGAADAQSQLVDDDLSARSKGQQLQLSIDVSDYVRESLNRPEASLRLEYRYDMGKSSDRGETAARERDGGHALLVTFSTPLN